jgi:hypothetical protein
MKKLISALFTIATGFILALMMPLAARAVTPAYTVTPWTFVGAANDCGSGTPAGTGGTNVVSRWVNDLGNPPPSLYLQKRAATSDCSSAGATINGVSGITLTKLGFDYYSGNPDEHCGGGAPRFNVVTTDNVTHFLGCSAGTTTATTNGWTTLTFDPTVSPPAFSPIASDMTVKSIDIVFDETGYVHLDNIVVNDTTIGRGNTPWTKNDCKNGGFKNFSDNLGRPFKNQGQCVAFVARGQHGLVLSSNTNINAGNLTHQSTNSTNGGGGNTNNTNNTQNNSHPTY